jgi:cysteinyl-tRNA synthetase
VKGLRARCEAAMCDDLNTPVAISHLFDAGRAINAAADGHATLSATDLEELKDVFHTFLEDLFGLRRDTSADSSREQAYRKAVDLLLNLRRQAKQNRDWAAADRIRDELSACGFTIKDTREGFEWTL